MDREISLKEIIEIMLKGKWIIIGLTVVALIISTIVSFFVLSPTFETHSLVRLQQSSDKDKIIPDLNSFTDTLKGDVSIKQIIDKLNIDTNKYSIRDIRKLLQLEVVKDANVMKITARGKDSKLITKISNMLAYELGSRIEISERSQRVAELITKQQEVLDNTKITESQLTEAQKQLANITETQTTKTLLVEDPLLKSIIEESTRANISDIAKLQLESETINPSYNTLQTKVAELTIELSSLKTENENIQADIQMNNGRMDQLEQLMLDEKLNVQKFERLIDGGQAIFISPAIEPVTPVAPNKAMNMAISTILGAMIAALYVFLRNYMKQSSKPVISVVE